jgi:DNA-binding CsgD family transcriptional regulator/tetratricopeptide (TPR) repeat protein
MTLIERDRELAALHGLHADCLDGRGRVAIVGGPVGSGKTALLHAFAEQTADAGGPFLSAAASRAERNLPLGVLSQLFRHLTPSREDSDAVRRLLADGDLAAAANGPDSPAAEQAVYTLHRLCDTLLGLGARTPTLIGVDDVHHADPASLRCLLYLVRRLRNTRILLVVNENTSHPPTTPPFSAELLRQPQCRRIRLGPLSRPGVADLLARHLGARAAPPLAAAWHAATGGSPLLVRALLEDRPPADADAPDADADAPDGAPDGLAFGAVFSQAVAACLAGVGDTAPAVAEALAVLGPQAPPAAVADLLGVDPDAVGRAVDALNATQLLDGGRYRHPAVRAVVLDGIDPPARAGMHARAARVLHGLGAPAPALAPHLVAAGAAGRDAAGQDWAVPALREAAEDALAEGETDRAIGYLRAAARACADDRDRAAVEAKLARAEWRTDPSTAIRRLPALAAAAREGRLDGPDAVRPVGYLLWAGRAEQAAEVLDALERRHASRARPDPDAAAGLDAARRWLRFSYPGLAAPGPDDDAPDADGADDDGGPAAAAGAPPALTAITVLGAALAGNPYGAAPAAAEQLLEAAHRGDTALAAVAAALGALVFCDRPDRAAFWCDPLLERAADRRSPTRHAVLAATRAMIGVRRGDFARAGRDADLALTRIGPKSWGVAVGVPLAGALLAATATGRHAEAAALLATPVPEAMFQTPYGLHYLQARGRHHRAVGRPHAAVRDFEACGELMDSWGVDLPALAPWRAEAAQTFLEAGDRARARDLAGRQLARLRPGRSRVRGLALRVLAEAGGAGDRPPLLREAADALRACGDRYELALALAALGRALHEVGEHREARAVAHRARRLAEQCGAPGPGRAPLEIADAAPAGAAASVAGDFGPGAAPPARLRGLRVAEPVPSRPAGPAGVPPAVPFDPEAGAPAELSDAERRVASLAARGCTNKQIANRLYITVSTVEQHLTRVYRKLRVSSRGDLPRYLQPVTPDRETGRRPVGGNRAS